MAVTNSEVEDGRFESEFMGFDCEKVWRSTFADLSIQFQRGPRMVLNHWTDMIVVLMDDRESFASHRSSFPL